MVYPKTAHHFSYYRSTTHLRACLLLRWWRPTSVRRVRLIVPSIPVASRRHYPPILRCTTDRRRPWARCLHRDPSRYKCHPVWACHLPLAKWVEDPCPSLGCHNNRTTGGIQTWCIIRRGEFFFVENLLYKGVNKGKFAGFMEFSCFG